MTRPLLALLPLLLAACASRASSNEDEARVFALGDLTITGGTSAFELGAAPDPAAIDDYRGRIVNDAGTIAGFALELTGGSAHVRLTDAAGEVVLDERVGGELVMVDRDLAVGEALALEVRDARAEEPGEAPVLRVTPYAR